jgi:hypothetical protein
VGQSSDAFALLKGLVSQFAEGRGRHGDIAQDHHSNECGGKMRLPVGTKKPASIETGHGDSNNLIRRRSTSWTMNRCITRLENQLLQLFSDVLNIVAIYCCYLGFDFRF